MQPQNDPSDSDPAVRFGNQRSKHRKILGDSGPAGHGLHDRNSDAIGHDGVEALHETDVIVIDKHVDVAHEAAVV